MNKKNTQQMTFRIFMFYCLLAFFFNRAEAQGQTHTVLSEANVEIPILSPLPLKVRNVEKSVISLNGEWQVAVNKGKQVPIQVPGELIMQGIDLNIGETAVYQKKVQLPNDWSKKKVFIRFDGVSSHALVKVNGQKVGEHEGSFVPFQMEISDALNLGNNMIEVDVMSHTISDILACTSQYAAHTVAGLLRKVTLFALPETHIFDSTVNTVFDKQFKNATLQLATKIDLSNSPLKNVQLRYTLRTADGKKVKQTTSSLVNIPNLGEPITHEVTVPIKKPKQWNPEQPYLYTLVTELLQEGVTLQENRQKIGFRQVEIMKGQVLVNGKPIKLRGINRHAVHPLSGRSISPDLDRNDAKLFKEANCNYIRTSHYPPSEEFLESADELGLFVESEASLTWIEHHASPIWGHWNYKDKKFLPHFLRANLDNIQAYKNHPSIIIWSLANESRWSSLWAKVNAVVKDLDPTRPTSFHDQCWGGFNNAGSTADIANYHYPGINGPSATDTMHRPVLFGEYSHLSTYNRRELLTDPGVRDAYNQPLVTFYDSIYRHPKNLGGAIWSGVDDTFHLPDGRIVGYGPWGPIDGWRRKKPEYFGMKKAYSPIKVTKMSQTKGSVLLEVENRYDFTSLSQIKIEATLDGRKIALKSNIPARNQGIIKIPLRKRPQTLSITFYDPNGFIAEMETYQLKTLKENPTFSNVPLSLSENTNSYLVNVGKISYRLSKLTGMVVSAKKNGQTVLRSGPLFTVAPMNSDRGQKNDIAGETYQRIISPIQTWPWYTKFASDIVVKKNENSIEFDIKVTFKEGKGTIKYRFGSDGIFTTSYEIEAGEKEIKPYQYGLMLQLPKDFDQLAWKRNGDFTQYPKDHIGRNEGSAKLNAVPTNGVEPWRKRPSGSWKDDANELGSNDFKSSKRNILRASLSNGDNTSVTVLSNGKQASRSWLQEEQVYWLVADYWNNGSEPFYGTPHSNGRITTKDRVLKGKITLRIQ